MDTTKTIAKDAGRLISTKALVFASLLCALSVAVGWVCKTYLSFGAIRITFENIPVLMAGMFFGPFIGALVGAASDIVSGLMAGYSINPIITLGAASVGIVSGIMSRYIIKRKGFVPILLSVLPAHIIGSMLIKSIGLYTYGYAIEILLLRIPLYVCIASAESYIIFLLTKNKEISQRLERM